MVAFLGLIGILFWVLSIALAVVSIEGNKDYRKKRREYAFYLFFFVAPSFLTLAAFLYLVIGL